MKKKILISTGGSGGHVIPAKILIDHLNHNFEVIISTDQRGEKYLKDVPNKKIKIYTPKLNNLYLIPLNLIKILFLTFIYIVFKRILTIEEERDKLILVGCSSLILMQAIIHIGVNIRLFPTTGMTLPFLSYGGSSIVSISIISGIVLNLTKRKFD